MINRTETACQGLVQIVERDDNDDNDDDDDN